MKVIDVEVKDIEIVGFLPHTIEHQHIVGDDVFRRRIKAHPFCRTAYVVGRSDRVPAGEERDLVPHLHEFFREITDDPLRPTVRLRRNAFDQRGYLSDPHLHSPRKSPDLLGALSGRRLGSGALQPWCRAPGREFLKVLGGSPRCREAFWESASIAI
jgi:hypothetical protein